MKAFSNTEHVWLQWVPAFPSLAANCILTVFLHCLSFALFCDPNPTGIKMITYVYETEHIKRTVLSAHPGALISIFAHCFWVTKKIFKGSNAYRDGKPLNRKIGLKVKRLAPTPYSPESSAKASQRQFLFFFRHHRSVFRPQFRQKRGYTSTQRMTWSCLQRLMLASARSSSRTWRGSDDMN